jgi:filamentous hemagglutinin
MKRLLGFGGPRSNQDLPNIRGEIDNDFRGAMPHPVKDRWVRTPSSIQDQMALDAARSGAGTKIIDNLGDPEFKGMEKWEYKVKSAEGRDSVVHYVRDPNTGELMDFKFKKQSTDD